MRLDGRLGLGFSLGQPCWVAAQQEDMCGRKGNRGGGGDLRKRKPHFSCSSSSDSTAKPEMMAIKTVQINIDTFCL